MLGKISLFGLDALVNMVAAAALHVEMRILHVNEKRACLEKLLKLI